ncbi:MAG: LamG-like jellyroll fold domain-containing protein [Chitinophagales bacterium]
MKRILLVLFAILITHTVFSQIPTANLLAWYPFCADTTDHGGGGRDLTVTGTGTIAPVPDTDRFGNVNTAYRFNGVNSLMRYYPYFSAAADFSYACWIYTTVKQSSLIIYNGHVNGNGFGLVMNNGTIGVAGDTVSILFGGQSLHLSTPISLNQWHHLVFTRGGNSYQLYVDTTLIGSFVDYFYPLISTDVFNVGYDYTSNTNAFKGKIDDIAVYSKQLTLDSIKALYFFNPDIIPFTLGNDTAICTNSVVLSPNPGTPGAQYLWSTGSTSTSVAVTPPVFPGANYWLTISKPYGCVNSDTIKVREVVARVNIGPQDTTFCAGNTKILNSPLVRVPGETYLWSTGDTTGTLPVNTAGTYWLTLDSLGCFGNDTITVTIKPQPSVNLGSDTASCLGNFVTLQSSTVYTTSVTYVWGAVPVLSAPITTTTLVASVTGTYWVTVTDTNGCPNADTIHVLIVNASFAFPQRDTAICQGASFSPSVAINPIVSYQWRPTTGMATSNVADPTIITSVSATYVLTGSYTGCPDIIDSFHLDIQPNPIVGYFGPPRSVCMNDTVHITAYVTPSWYTHYIYHWSPGVNLDDSTATTVVFTAGDTTDLILTVTTPAGCVGSDSIMINVHPSSFLTIAPDSALKFLCPGDSTQFRPYIIPTLVEPTTVTYQWIPSIYVSAPNTQSPWIHPITSESYTIIGTSQFGCQDTVSASIIVHPAAVIYLEDSTVIYPGESYIIAPQTNCTYFSWWPELGLNNTGVSDPIATPAVNTTYIVHASTEFCTTVDSIKIRVSPATLIAIPNAFTPGTDINNYLKVMRKGLASLNYFHIFDRWGTMVYDSKDIDAGWDGAYKGQPQPLGVYVYEIEAITNTGRVCRKQGNVTLIR